MSKQRLHGAALAAKARSKHKRGLKLTKAESSALHEGEPIPASRALVLHREGRGTPGTMPNRKLPKNPKRVAAGKKAAAAKKAKQEELARKRSAAGKKAAAAKKTAARKAAGHKKGEKPMAAKKSAKKSKSKKARKSSKKEKGMTLLQRARAKQAAGKKTTRRERGALGAAARKRKHGKKTAHKAAARKATSHKGRRKSRKSAKGQIRVIRHKKGKRPTVSIPKGRSIVVRARRKNPLSGGEFFPAIAGFAVGSLIASLADRVAATHAITSATGATGTPGATGSVGYTDAPAAGQMYNAEVLNAPIWTNWKRGAAAVVAVALPLGLGAMSKSAAAKDFWHLAFFGALAPTAVKTLNDAIAMLVKKTLVGQRLYAQELAAQADAKAALAATNAPAQLPLPGSLQTSVYGQVSGAPALRRLGRVGVNEFAGSDYVPPAQQSTNPPAATTSSHTITIQKGSSSSTPSTTTTTTTTPGVTVNTPSVPQYTPTQSTTPQYTPPAQTPSSGCGCGCDIAPWIAEDDADRTAN